MLTIEIDDTPVETRSFTKRETGEVFEFRQQQAYLHGNGKYPLPFSIDIQQDAEPHKPGRYSIDLSSFQIERGRLVLARYFKLTPVQSTAALKSA